MRNHFETIKILLLVWAGGSLTACADYHFKYYSPDGKHWITRCSYRDSTYFLNGRNNELKKEQGYVVIQDRDFRSGWDCLITFSGDTAVVIAPTYEFYIRNNPKKLKLKYVVRSEMYVEIYQKNKKDLIHLASE
ncbi:hypothetical protein [Spirosoma sp.]|uniref:hypothetical protein n=1 Tax=Spirosoma sp. TaxID=1899569 RepID=UPI003B3AE6AC